MTAHEYILYMTKSPHEAKSQIASEKEEKALKEATKNKKEQDLRDAYPFESRRSDGSKEVIGGDIKASSKEEWKKLYDRKRKILQMLWDGKSMDEIYEEMSGELEPSYFKEKK